MTPPPRRPAADWATLDPLLLALYADGPPPRGAVAALARAHGHPPARLHTRIQWLRAQGAPVVRHTYHRWTPEQCAILEEEYERRGPSGFPEWGRSPDAVAVQARALGLTTRTAYSLTDLATAIGCSTEAVSYWMRRGYLRVRISRGGRPDGTGRKWVLQDSEIGRFLTTYPDLWQDRPCPGRAWLEAFLPQAPRVPAGRRPRPVAGVFDYAGPGRDTRGRR